MSNIAARHSQSAGTISEGKYYIVFNVKYRVPLISETIRRDLDKIIRDKCQEFETDLSLLDIHQDRIEIMVSLPPIHSPHFFVQQLKRSTGKLREKYGEIRRRVPSMWNRDYFCSLVGTVDFEALKEFNSSQKRGASNSN